MWTSYCNPVSSQVSVILLHFSLFKPSAWPWGSQDAVSRPVGAAEVGCAESPQDGCRCSLGPLSWRRADVESSISQVTVHCQILLCSVGELVETNGSPSPQQPCLSLCFKWQNVPEHRHLSSICLTAGGLDLWHGEVKKMRAVLTSASVWFDLSCFVRQSP